MQAKKAWDKVTDYIKNTLGDRASSWLLNVKPVSIDKENFVISVDNNFLKEKIENDFKLKILQALENIFLDSRGISLDVVVEKEYSKEEPVEIDEIKEIKSIKEEKYTFQNFIVGKSNEFAHAAARGVAISPGKVYNPLFIYGGVGLGKTHLMHAIGNYVISKNPEAKVHYCSSEQFTNNLINSLKKDRMPQFREKYRKLDILLVDDIQFIVGKESTQEEFFHTFNTLHQYSRQIVVSSDRPPNEIKNIEDRLVSRFTWGLVADIKAPDYETRVAILKKKAETEGVDIPDEAISYIAEAVKSNIRELEGSLNRVAAKASLLGRKIDFDLIKEVFKDFVEDKAKKVTKDKVLKQVSVFYKISPEEISSNSRKKEVAKARQVCMYLLRDLLNMPFSAIGAAFGGKDHTTAMHSVNKIESEVNSDSDLKFEIEQVKQGILR